MSALAPATDAALSSSLSIFAVVALKIELPGATIRLLDGSAAIYIEGELYTGRDATFGTFTSMAAVSDGVDNQTPTLRFVMLPPTNAAMAALAAPAAQGSPVTAMIAVVSPTSGQVVGDPIVFFVGELDQPTNKIGMQTKTLQLDCISVFDDFLTADEWVKLNNSFHQYVWPGELGFEFISAIDVRPPWGSDAPRIGLTANTSTY